MMVSNPREPIANALLIHNIGHHDFYILIQHGQTELLVKPDSLHIYKISHLVESHFLQQATPVNSIQYTQDEVRFQTAIECHIDQISVNKLYGSHSKKLDPYTCSQVWNPDTQSIKILGFKLPLIASITQQFTKEYQSHTDYQLNMLLITSGPIEVEYENTTIHVGKIIQQWITYTYPSIRCQTIHKPGDPFEYNSKFVRLNIVPIVELYRLESQQRSSKNWVDYFTLILSISTGTPSTILSLVHAFSDFKPFLYHIPYAKRWPKKHSKQIHIKRYDEVRQSPRLSVDEIASLAQYHQQPDYLTFAIQAMQSWYQDFIKARPERPTDQTITADEHFFFRKGIQEVLAIIVVHVPHEDIEAIRGVNLEVSLPTGTLCAERNAIGSALSKFPNLKRSDIKAVAILRANKDKGARLGPCGACKEWLRKIDEVNPAFRVLTFADHLCEEIYVDRIEQV